MAKQQLTDFTLPTDAYASFDAVSLKALIKERLNDKSFFTDQNFEGSNLSSVIDIISYSYHVLLFYLNQTASESIFTEAELYENMNRIVKLLDYKPVGAQTSILPITVTGSANLTTNTYTIPRYSFIDAGGTFYSTKQDISFEKTLSTSEEIKSIGNNHMLYEGKYFEYPSLIATGEDSEIFTMLPGDDVIIDHFTIDMYVKDVNTGKWSEWKKTSSLFLEDPTTKAFEVRLNENKRYEIKVGNGLNGAKLNLGDEVAIYYVRSTGIEGEVGVNAADGTSLIKYNAVQFTEIFNEIKDSNINYITDEQITLLTITNSQASSPFTLEENVDKIRENAPNIFTTQYRLVTKQDYESHIKHEFSNILKDVKVLNNWDYIDGRFKYLTETLELAAVNKDANTLYNQATFADSCDFNNVYVYGIPVQEKTSSGSLRHNYLTSGQKSSIIDSLRDRKSLTTETVIVDPVYVAVSIGAKKSNEIASTTQKDVSVLRLIRSADSAASFEGIKNQAYNIIKNHLDSLTLGSTINVTQLTNELLSIGGVTNIKTVRTDADLELDGLQLLAWNPIYPKQDVKIITSNEELPKYKYPYLHDPIGFKDSIEVVSAVSSTGSVIEY